MSNTYLTSLMLPNVFLNLKSSFSVSILKFSLEYTVEILGNLHTDFVAVDSLSMKVHVSSHTEMKLLTESLRKMVDRPSAVTSSLHPPANEQVRPDVALVTVRVFLRVVEILA